MHCTRPNESIDWPMTACQQFMCEKMSVIFLFHAPINPFFGNDDEIEDNN